MQNRKIEDLKSKKEPSTLTEDELLLTLLDPTGPEAQKVEKLGRLVHQLEQPKIRIQASTSLILLQLGGLGAIGLLEQQISVKREVSPDAVERKPYLVDRLTLNDELMAKHSTLKLNPVTKQEPDSFITREEMAKSAFGQSSNTARRLR